MPSKGFIYIYIFFFFFFFKKHLNANKTFSYTLISIMKKEYITF